MVFGWFIVFLAVTNKTFDVTIQGFLRTFVLFSLFLSKYVGVEFLGQVVRVWLRFCETAF